MISRKQTLDTFLTLVNIDGKSGNEKEVANYIKKRMLALGLSVIQDNAGETFGGNAGNLICYLPGKDEEITPIMLCAHMDSIESTADIKTVIEDDIIKSDGTTILAADDRVGVTAIIEAINAVVENKISTGPIYCVFTVAEEIGMYGSRNLSKKTIPVDVGFVLDSSAQPGDIITTAPSSNMLEIKIIGKAAHAAVQPENGIDAIKIASEAISKLESGRVSETCTINFGVINGGKAINIVADEVIIKADVRSTKKEESEFHLKKIVDVFSEIANKFGGKSDIIITKKYDAFDLNKNEHVVEIASEAVKGIGLKPNCIKYPGGSDANLFNSLGIPSVNFGLGYRNVHSKQEYVSIDNLVTAAEIGLSICRTAFKLSEESALYEQVKQNN